MAVVDNLGAAITVPPGANVTTPYEDGKIEGLTLKLVEEYIAKGTFDLSLSGTLTLQVEAFSATINYQQDALPATFKKAS